MKYLQQSLNTCIFYREPVNTDEASFDDGVCGNSSSSASVLSAKGNIDVVQMMKEMLQPYMVNCLVAAGYDDFDAISTMNTSENYGNSIRKIEDYIDLPGPYPGGVRGGSSEPPFLMGRILFSV